jgi:hypothetical protein
VAAPYGVSVPEQLSVPRSDAEVAEDDYWTTLYGAWDPFDPAGVRAFFDGFDRPWWVVGGWTIDAFTGVPRGHEDLDVSVLACDVPALRAHVRGRWHLWSISKEALRPLTDEQPELGAPDGQIWVRRDAASPWVLDLPVTPDRDGRWTSKRMPDDVRDLDEATWVAADGVRYLRPEITLLFKARLDRTKDRHDRDVTWPLLDAGARAWLVESLRGLDPEHGWLADLT